MSLRSASSSSGYARIHSARSARVKSELPEPAAAGTATPACLNVSTELSAPLELRVDTGKPPSTARRAKAKESNPTARLSTRSAAQ